MNRSLAFLASLEGDIELLESVWKEQTLEERIEILMSPNVNDKNSTHLHYAVRSGSVKMVNFIFNLLSPAQITDLLNRRDTDHRQPIHFISFGSTTIENRLLLLRKIVVTVPEDTLAMLDSVDIYGMTPLHHAAKEGHPEIIQELYSLGSQAITMECQTDSSLNFPQSLLASKVEGYLPIHIAARYGRTDAAKMILECGGELDIPAGGPLGSSAIHLSCEQGQVETTLFLLDAGANISYDSAGFLPLHRAIRNGHLSILKAWYARDPNIIWAPHRNLASNGICLTPVVLAVQANQMECARQIQAWMDASIPGLVQPKNSSSSEEMEPISKPNVIYNESEPVSDPKSKPVYDESDETSSNGCILG